MSGPDLDDVEEESRNYHDTNVELRNSYLEISARIQQAQEAGDSELADQLARQLTTIGNSFFENNRGLAAAVAKTFLGQSPSNSDDYLSAAALGLWEAFCKWDPTKETTFGTFSRNYIKGSVTRAVRKYEYSHMGQGDFNRRVDVREASEALAEKLGRAPTYAEIAEKAETSIGVVQRSLTHAPASLDRTLGTDDNATLGDLIADEDTSSHVETLEDVSEDVLAELNDLQLWITLARRQLLGHEDDVSIMDISDAIGKGRESVRRASECADLRILSSSFALKAGRNPTWAELMKLNGRDLSADKEKALKSMFQMSCVDIQQRWHRASEAADTAAERNDRAGCVRAWSRLDRIGEEALAQHRELVLAVAQRYVTSSAGKSRAVRVRTEQAAELVWSSILTWTEDSGTLASYVHARAAARWETVGNPHSLIGPRKPHDWWSIIRQKALQPTA